MKYIQLFGIIFWLVVPTTTTGQYLIEGKCTDATIPRIAHLDILNHWNEFSTVTDEMTIKSVKVDSSGHYRFEGNELAESWGFYRVRFTQVGVTPIMIETSPRNYINFAFRNRDTIRMLDQNMIPNNSTNQQIQQLTLQWDQFIKEKYVATNPLHENLVAQKMREFFKVEIQAGQDPMVQLFALGHGFELANEDLPLFKKVKRNIRRSTYRPTYQNTLQESISVPTYAQLSKRYTFLLFLLIGSLVLNLVLGYAWWKRSKTARSVLLEKPNRKPELTQKEVQVVQLILQSKTNKEIAQHLFVSEATIKSHINNIYRKLGIQSRKEVKKRMDQLNSAPV